MTNIELRKASLIDLPFIFYQMYDGSINGAFSDSFISRHGLVSLFSFLIRFFIPSKSCLFKTSSIQEAFIYGDNQCDFGFIITIAKPKKNNESQYITIVAAGIQHQHRVKGLGQMMIKSFLESLDPNTEVHAYCTKYSKVMQHIFRKHKFIRDTKRETHLEHFYLIV